MVATFVEAPGFVEAAGRPKLRLLPARSGPEDGTEGVATDDDGRGAKTAWVDVRWPDLAEWARTVDPEQLALPEAAGPFAPQSRISRRQQPASLGSKATQPSKATFRRRRIVAAGLVVAGLFALLVGVQALFGRSGPPALGTGSTVEPAAAHIWVVRPGDTLWSIALASGARGDIRPLVDEMNAEVHGLPLQPGEHILVP
jgi:hypothetical protein